LVGSTSRRATAADALAPGTHKATTAQVIPFISHRVTVVVKTITDLWCTRVDGRIIVIAVPVAGCDSIAIAIVTLLVRDAYTARAAVSFAAQVGALIDSSVAVIVYSITDFRNGNTFLENCNPCLKDSNSSLESIN
jgi:hypothetical protein